MTTQRMTANAGTTARDVRKHLAPLFGSVKFSVTVQTRKTKKNDNGERWLTVRWIGGPSAYQVLSCLPKPKLDEADPCPFHLVQTRRRKEQI